MSVEQPPIYYFQNIDFNSSFYATETFTETQANTLYLRKRTPDTATALETFNAGILSASINPITSSSTMNIGTTTVAGNINIGTSSVRVGDINIGNGTTPSGDVFINNGSSNGTTTNINTGTTTSGQVNLMTGSATGFVNIATGTGSARVNIGSGTTTGLITIGNSANNTSLLGGVRMPTLLTTNYISRRGNITQNIPSGGVDTTVLFPELLSPGNASLVYTSGVFTNSSNRQLTLMVSYTVSFSNASTVGTRNVKINNSTTSPQVAYNIVDAATTGFTSITGSATFVLANTQAFNIQCFQNSSISLPLDTTYTTIQVLMF